MGRIAAVVAVMAAVFVSMDGQAAQARAPDDLETRVLAEINFARTQPQAYARELRRAASKGGVVGYSQIANEDLDTLAETLDFLADQKPLPPLRADRNLAEAARSHAEAQGRTREVGHVSPNGATLSQRLQAHQVWAGLAAENISYGYDDPREVVRQLIIDSRVPGRGHRQNIFGHGYQAAGVSCAPHRQWGAMCVIDFAGAFVQR